MDRRLSLTFIGTATVLLRWGALTLLTDPNFLHRGQFAYLGKGMVSRRLTEPALSVADLPPLSGVVLSHLHGDHFDRVARRGLDRAVPILTTPHARRRLTGRHGFQAVQGLATWESTTLTAGPDQVRVTATPARHARGPVQALLPPVMGSVLEFGPVGGAVERRVWVSGDTMDVPELRAIPLRYPDIDVAVLHLGGTRVPGGLAGGLLVTLDAVAGTDVLELVDPVQAVPVHHDDYGVFRSPLADFRAEVERRGLSSLVRVVERGETAQF
ncbi:MBL fold metallo-hydrolase [Kineococcus sp. SYSU DK001]|uniref:MBL fold metallo-hydrolase n=1 Tax=Kineococcus sp. SYSU DK001 TaxID=3383122 RepID=UPI003D7CBA68